MSRRDSALAVVVAVIWGLNFLAVRVALDHYPPFLLAALRYLLVAVPVVLFVAPPKVPLRWLVGYGMGSAWCSSACSSSPSRSGCRPGWRPWRCRPVHRSPSCSAPPCSASG